MKISIHKPRQLQYHFNPCLLGMAITMALGHCEVQAANLVVNTVNPNILADGKCALIEAIDNSNANQQTHQDCPPGGGADVIHLPASTTLTLTKITSFHDGYYSDSPNGLPLILDDLTIEGHGSTITRNQTAPDFRIMAVTNNAKLQLNNMTLSGGVSEYVGGALLNVQGDVTLNRCTISGNSAGDGGGLENFRTKMTIINSSITGNHSSYGGGLANVLGEMQVVDSTISGNRSDRRGGGIASRYGSVHLRNSTVSGNKSSSEGGGIFSFGAYINLVNSTVSGNRANRGGGLFHNYVLEGIWLDHTTLTNNTATESGGGVEINDGRLILQHSLISGNSAPIAAEIHNPVAQYGGGVIQTNDFNLLGHGQLTNSQAFTRFTPGTSDINATANGEKIPLTAILNSVLADNGGNTKTHVLVGNSRAINASAIDCLTTDQRGVARPQPSSNNCDIGSVEMSPPGAVDLAVGVDELFEPIYLGDTVTYIVTVNNSGLAKATGIKLTDSFSGAVRNISVKPSTGVSCQIVNNRIDCLLPDLNSGARTTVTITAKTTVLDTITNSAQVTSTETDVNPVSNFSSESTLVTELQCQGYRPTLVGTRGDDTLTGTAGRDIIQGLSGQDKIDGKGGDDIICGGAGDDIIKGNDGHDVIDGERGADTLYGGKGNDKLNGAEDRDTLKGEDDNDSLLGGVGNDRLEGGNGDDLLHGEDENDVLLGNDGLDQLFGDDGKDNLDGGLGDDQLEGGELNDTLMGRDGNDILKGDAGNDRLEGGNGLDLLEGGVGNDTLLGNDNIDQLNGDEGNDNLSGGDGNDRLDGGSETDSCAGNSGTDTATNCETFKQ